MHRGDAALLLRKRLEAAGRRHAATIASIHADLTRAKAECRQEYDQIRTRLDDAVTKEAEAEAAARVDKTKAEERRKAAHARKVAASADRRAQSAEKLKRCKAEAEAKRKEKRAAADYNREAVAIERSMLKKEARPPRWASGLRKSEEREQVEMDVPDRYRPLWKRVGRTFKVPAQKEGLASMLEAFVEYADENPEAVVDAQEAELQAEARRLQAEENRQARAGRGKRARRADLPDAPF